MDPAANVFPGYALSNSDFTVVEEVVVSDCFMSERGTSTEVVKFASWPWCFL